jgi:hypothetical protein
MREEYLIISIDKFEKQIREIKNNKITWDSVEVTSERIDEYKNELFRDYGIDLDHIKNKISSFDCNNIKFDKIYEIMSNDTVIIIQEKIKPKEKIIQKKENKKSLWNLIF